MLVSQFNYLFILKNAHWSSNSYNFWIQPNIPMKFAGYVAWILLCKHCKFGEKITTILEISNFSYGITILARPVNSIHANSSNLDQTIVVKRFFFSNQTADN